MLKVRVIPTLLWKNFGLVKGVSFDSWRSIGSVLPAIKVYNRREVDEMILVDIDANLSNENFDVESLEDFSQDCFVPLTVGGGLNSASEVQKLLRAGADKVSINTCAYDNPELITEIAKIHGSQCVVASIDVKKASNDCWQCYSHSGTIKTEKTAVEWAKELEDRGAGEILITSIDNDGTMIGYDLALIERISSSVDIPVIASGGAGCYQDMIDAVQKSGASAVAAASIFHFTEQTPKEAKIAMSEAGIQIRKNYENF